MASEDVIRIRRRGMRRVQRGHPWIYRSDVESVPEGTAGGALVPVAGPEGRPFAVAAWSDCSEIALRCTPIPLGSDVDEGWLELVDSAVARRERGEPLVRLVNADGDGLPGLVVDRYGDWLSIQTLTQTAARLQQPTVERLLAAAANTRSVVARNAARARVHEGLPREDAVLVGEPPAVVQLETAGLAMSFDLLAGQKTGGYLDQRANWRLAGGLVRGEALDAFCYEGGFALHMARAGARVTALDSSRPALERLADNARLNRLEVSTECVNVFDRLRALEREGRRFDMIVLDPPALAKARAAVEAGRRAYKELNLRALKLLRPGGRLLTCSCSANLTREDFEATVRSAAADARRWVRLVERGGAGPDHPALLAAPETDYLKVLVLEVE